MDGQKQEICLETAARAALPAQAVYAVMAIVFGVGAYRTEVSSLTVEYSIGVLMCIWLIYCRRPVLCRLREDEMTVTVAEEGIGLQMLASLGRRRYLIVPYGAVAGVSADWRRLCLRNRQGLHSVVPVDWQELTAQDRGRILRAVGTWNDTQRKQQEQQEEG